MAATSSGCPVLTASPNLPSSMKKATPLAYGQRLPISRYRRESRVAFGSPLSQGRIREKRAGTTVPGLSRSAIRRFSFSSCSVVELDLLRRHGVCSSSSPGRIAAPFSRTLRQFVNRSIETSCGSLKASCVDVRSSVHACRERNKFRRKAVGETRTVELLPGREGRSDPTSSRPVALLVFLAAAAGAGIIAADLIVGTVSGSRRSHWLISSV